MNTKLGTTLAKARTVILACLITAATPPSAEGQRPAPPTISAAGAETCRIGEVHELGTAERRRTRVAVSFRGDHGLAAWATSQDELTVRPIGPDARPAGPAVVTAFRRADRLQWLVGTPTGTVALSAGDLCDRFANSCFQALALGDDGHALGVLLHEPENQWNTVTATAVGGPWLYAMNNGRWGVDPVRYRIAADGSLSVEEASGMELVGATAGDFALRAVATTPTGRAFVLVNHDGLTGRVTRLYDWDGQRNLPLMRGFGQDSYGFDVDLMEVDGDAIVILGEGKYFRVGFDGRVLVGPERIREREALPEVLRDRMVVSVESRRRQTVFVRRDLAGAEVGEAVRLAPSPSRNWDAPYGQVAWIGGRFVVVSGEPAGTAIRITSRTIDCGPTS